jgi:hypothetical protein
VEILMPDHKTFMPFESHSILFNLSTQPVSVRYGLAFLAVTVTTIATIYIPVIGERAAFLLFFFGIITSSENVLCFKLFVSIVLD